MSRIIKYHYYAFKEIAPGQMMHWDGIANYRQPIQTQEDFDALKMLIGGEQFAPGMIIANLSVLSDVLLED